jgi:hypothetical protein
LIEYECLSNSLFESFIGLMSESFESFPPLIWNYPRPRCLDQFLLQVIEVLVNVSYFMKIHSM